MRVITGASFWIFRLVAILNFIEFSSQSETLRVQGQEARGQEDPNLAKVLSHPIAASLRKVRCPTLEERQIITSFLLLDRFGNYIDCTEDIVLLARGPLIIGFNRNGVIRPIHDMKGNGVVFDERINKRIQVDREHLERFGVFGPVPDEVLRLREIHPFGMFSPKKLKFISQSETLREQGQEARGQEDPSLGEVQSHPIAPTLRKVRCPSIEERQRITYFLLLDHFGNYIDCTEDIILLARGPLIIGFNRNGVIRPIRNIKGNCVVFDERINKRIQVHREFLERLGVFGPVPATLLRLGEIHPFGVLSPQNLSSSRISAGNSVTGSQFTSGNNSDLSSVSKSSRSTITSHIPKGTSSNVSRSRKN